MVQQPLMPIAAALKLKASRTSQSTTVETIASRAEAAPCNVAYSSGIKAVMTAEKSASETYDTKTASSLTMNLKIQAGY